MAVCEMYTDLICYTLFWVILPSALATKWCVYHLHSDRTIMVVILTGFEQAWVSYRVVKARMIILGFISNSVKEINKFNYQK